jgi:hypothetical protein
VPKRCDWPPILLQGCWFVPDSPLEENGFELLVPRAMQERLKAIIAGFGCNPPSPDYLRLLSADITEGGPKRSLGTGSLNARGTGSSNPFPSSGESCELRAAQMSKRRPQSGLGGKSTCCHTVRTRLMGARQRLVLLYSGYSESSMRVLWFHLADLFLAIPEASQCGFLGLGDKE